MQRIPFSQLLEEVENDYALLTYYELLNTIEWGDKRKFVIHRDGGICQICKKGETITKYNSQKEKEYYWVVIPENVRQYKNSYFEDGNLLSFFILDDRDFIYTKAARHSILHVHHKYYIKGTLPWDYKDDCFLTLCVHCHFTLHETEQIPVYVKNSNGTYEKTELTPCSRCNGAGILPQFDYYMGGICFRCWGAKYDQFLSDKFKNRSKEVYDRMKRHFLE